MKLIFWNTVPVFYNKREKFYGMFTGAVEKILGEFGSLSVLIHNAGRSQRARWERTHIQAVLGIRHIVVRIQIRQLWLMDPDPTFFCSVTLRMQKKNNFSHIFFLELAHRHIIFSVKNKIFCKNFVLKSYFASIISEKARIRIRIRTSDLWIRILEAQKHADQDPQHCI